MLNCFGYGFWGNKKVKCYCLLNRFDNTTIMLVMSHPLKLHWNILAAFTVANKSKNCVRSLNVRHHFVFDFGLFIYLLSLHLLRGLQFFMCAHMAGIDALSSILPINLIISLRFSFEDVHRKKANVLEAFEIRTIAQDSMHTHISTMNSMPMAWQPLAMNNALVWVSELFSYFSRHSKSKH